MINSFSGQNRFLSNLSHSGDNSMTNHWENETQIINLARKAMMIEMGGNFRPETITTVVAALGVLDQVLDLYEGVLKKQEKDELAKQ